MARRRRSKIPRKRSSRLLMATQVVLLLGILVVILFFRDFIANGAGEMLGAFGPSDVQVQQGAQAPPEDGSAGAPDTGASAEESRDAN